MEAKTKCCKRKSDSGLNIHRKFDLYFQYAEYSETINL